MAMGENKSDRIGLEELRYISILQDLTGAMVYRALEDDNDNRIIYLVDRNDVGKAIGRDGRNVKMLSKMLNKNIEIVEYANDIDNMVRNLLPGVTVLKVEVTERDGLKIVYVKVKDDEKGKAIGRDGRNVKMLSKMLNKNIEIVEYANDIDNMVRNLLPGVTVLKVEVTERDGLKTVYVKVKDDEKGKAIGRDGRNVKRARLVLNRLFNVDRVVIR